MRGTLNGKNRPKGAFDYHKPLTDEGLEGDLITFLQTFVL